MACILGIRSLRMIEGRHRPERVEIDFDRLGLHHRRLAIDLADARLVVAHHHAVLDGLDRGRRNIQGARSDCRDRRRRPEPNQIDLELLQPDIGRNVERVEQSGSLTISVVAATRAVPETA